jgi:dihydrodipicolinate reductase
MIYSALNKIEVTLLRHVEIMEMHHAKHYLRPAGCITTLTEAIPE